MDGTSHSFGCPASLRIHRTTPRAGCKLRTNDPLPNRDCGEPNGIHQGIGPYDRLTLTASEVHCATPRLAGCSSAASSTRSGGVNAPPGARLGRSSAPTRVGTGAAPVAKSREEQLQQRGWPYPAAYRHGETSRQDPSLSAISVIWNRPHRRGIARSSLAP